jgi:hypothetical protein
MGNTAMHPLENTTRFFAVVGAPYIPENHRDDCCDEAPRHFAAAESEQACLQTTPATAWWPRNCH